MKKISTIIVLCLLALVVTGCRKVITADSRGVISQNGGEIDTTKTQIYVGNYYGGLGDAWLVKLKKEFEEMYKDYELNGKKGVEIVIDDRKNEFSGETLVTTISSSYNEIFFTEKVTLPNFLDQNLLYDITDVVNTYDLGEFYEDEKGTYIKDKLSTVDEFLTRGSKYYALPFYEGFYTLIYDADLFLEKGFYFVDGYEEETNLEDKFIVDGSDTKSAGPDGKLGTYDDGLPATYDDFYDLCKYMLTDKTVAAMTYPGSYAHYWLRFLFNMWSDYEGYDQMNLNFTLDGDATDIVKSIGKDNTLELETVKITNDNSAMLQKQAGKYYALDFVYNLAKNSNYFSSKSGSNTHTDAQNQFVWGKYDSGLTAIGMLLDGSWFESEATGAFETAAVTYGEQASKANRNIGIMPLPKATKEQVGTKSTYLGTNYSFCFINANTSADKIDIVKKFYAFCHTNHALTVFTKVTGMCRPFDYTIEDTSELTFFAKSAYNIHKNSNVVYPYSLNSYVNENSTKFAMDNWSFTSTVKGTPYANPFTAFANYDISVEEFFNGMYDKQK